MGLLFIGLIMSPGNKWILSVKGFRLFYIYYTIYQSTINPFTANHDYYHLNYQGNSVIGNKMSLNIKFPNVWFKLSFTGSETHLLKWGEF